MEIEIFNLTTVSSIGSIDERIYAYNTSQSIYKPTSDYNYSVTKNKSLKTPGPTLTATRPWDFGEITLLILLVFGTVGNLLSIMVMRTKRMRNTNAALFVTCMAVSDTALLLLKFIANMIKLYRISIYNLCILIQVIPQAATFISVWLIIITSAERTVAVLVPLKVAIIFSKKRCQIIICAMISFFILLSSSTSLCIHYSKKQPYYCQIRGDQNGTCFFYYTYVFPWIKSAFGSWLPSILGIVLNLVIISALYKASDARKHITGQISSNSVKRTNRSVSIAGNQSIKDPLFNSRRSIKEVNYVSTDHVLAENYDCLVDGSKINKRGSSDVLEHVTHKPKNRFKKFSIASVSAGTPTSSHGSTSPKERQITIMLMTISISFIIFTLPYSTYELLRKLGANSKWFKNRNLLRACMLLIDINHSTNFILYCLTAQRFRNELKNIICNGFNRDTKNNAYKSTISNSFYYSTNGQNRRPSSYVPQHYYTNNNREQTLLARQKQIAEANQKLKADTG